MSVPCSICADEGRGKRASAYWRWQSSPDDWNRFKQRFCAACFSACVVPLYLRARAVTWGECVQDDERPCRGNVTMTWVTMYTPKANDPINFEFGECEEHGPDAFGQLVRGAEDLNDRPQGSGRGRPLPDPWEGVDVPV